MPAWHSARSVPAAPSLLCAEPLGVLSGAPRPPRPRAEGGHGEGLPGESLLQGLHAPAFPARALPRPTGTGRYPRGRATSAQCPVAPLDPHMAQILGISSWLLPEPRASVSPSRAQPQPFRGVESAWSPTPRTDPSARPHLLPHQNEPRVPIVV